MPFKTNLNHLSRSQNEIFYYIQIWLSFPVQEHFMPTKTLQNILYIHTWTSVE